MANKRQAGTDRRRRKLFFTQLGVPAGEPDNVINGVDNVVNGVDNVVNTDG